MSSIARRIASLQWTPRRLGSGLYAAWDPEEPSSLSLSGGSLVTFTDYVNGLAPTQAIGSARASVGFSAFNGRRIITPDGVDDQNTVTTLPGTFPTGATPFELWVIWNQTSLVADATVRSSIFWGNPSNAFTGIARDVISGVNRARLYVGNGSSVIQPTNLNVDLSGRHVLRAVVDGVNARVDVDGIAGAALAVVPNISTTRLRLFANVSTTASAFGSGDFSGFFVTRLLTAGEAAFMLPYCSKRIV